MKRSLINCCHNAAVILAALAAGFLAARDRLSLSWEPEDLDATKARG